MQRVRGGARKVRMSADFLFREIRETINTNEDHQSLIRNKRNPTCLLKNLNASKLSEHIMMYYYPAALAFILPSCLPRVPWAAIASHKSA